jgi:D-lactate dehydrogenase
MKELKQLIDPDNILNPGVILNEDKDCHLRNLKSLPVVEEEVDKCVECGYCERSCPSREYTLTPRQRIVLRRSLSRLKAAGDMVTHDAIARDYRYDGMATCAVDGMCATNCPVDINTGELIKRLRREDHSRKANAIALFLARNFGKMEWGVKAGLRIGSFINFIFGRGTMFRLTGLIRKVIPACPLWTRQLTGPLKIVANTPPGPDAVYFSCCMNRMMGRDPEKKDSIVDAAVRLAERADLKLSIPEGLNGVCCGQAFASKGFIPAYRLTVNRTIERLWEWTEQGRIPVVIDISSCTHSLHTCRSQLEAVNQERFDRMRIVDSLEFAVDTLLPRLTIRKMAGVAVFHPVCSLHKMDLYGKMVQLASLTVEEPVIPFTAGCCGMAGDRGFFYPGLTAAAGKDEGAEAGRQAGDGYYSTARPCEMAMSEAAGKSYRSIFYLLDEVSGPSGVSDLGAG